MLFNSPEFLLGFLPVAVLLFFLIARVNSLLAASWLALASLFFYGWWNPPLVLLLLASILFNYSAGISIARRQGTVQARRIVGVSIAANLALLGYFKYTDFAIGVVDSLSDLDFPFRHIILPLGISFFTFTQIAFLVDVYRGLAREYRFIHYLLFVSYFPHLIAGPILHHSQMMPQFSDPKTYRFQLEPAVEGAITFLIGLAKKVVIADGLAHFVVPVFDAADHGQLVTFVDGWAAALGYTFELYFDFSGYSDMAIGLSRLFGIDLPLNFASPYRATNIIEFWRRWHMTLSRFLRDYLYIPLGGNRHGAALRYVNLLITMALGGLWHGASWSFVLWGILHGGYLVVCHAWHATKKILVGSHRPWRWTLDVWTLLALLLTFFSVVFAWVLFRCTTLAGAFMICRGMAGLNGFLIPEQFGRWLPHLPAFVQTAGRMPLLGNNSVLGAVEELGLIVIAAILCWCFPSTQNMSLRLQLLSVFASFAFVFQAVFFGRAPSPFLYFQF